MNTSTSHIGFLSLLLLVLTAAPVNRSSFVNGRAHAGEELTCDLPGGEHLRNIGSDVDHSGMCVMTSIETSARWHGLESLRGLRDWCAKEPGGAYPAKVDRQLKAFCAARGIAAPPYLQYEGRNVAVLLELCERTGRMACMTYGYSPRYGGTIAHMTCCPKFGGRFAVCLDSNFPGENGYEWMTRDELVRRITHPTGSGWLFIWLAPPPPPPPHN